MLKLALLTLVLVGCSSEHEASAELDARVGADASDPRANTRPDGGTSDASLTRTLDGGDAALGWPNPWFEAGQGHACTEEPECPLTPAATVDLTGESPLGPARVTKVGLFYVGGDVEATGLLVRVEAGGQSLVISTAIYSPDRGNPASPVAPPGSYGTSDLVRDYGDTSAGFMFCEQYVKLHQVTFRIDQHEAAQGSNFLVQEPVHIAGEWTVSDPGWSLKVPFDLRGICASEINI